MSGNKSVQIRKNVWNTRHESDELPEWFVDAIKTESMTYKDWYKKVARSKNWKDKREDAYMKR